jgi:anti-sigma regulatory factor (Ser/Thr protein kinase)
VIRGVRAFGPYGYPIGVLPNHRCRTTGATAVWSGPPEGTQRGRRPKLPAARRSPLTTASLSPERGYRHEAFFYADDDEFFAGMLDFIRDGIAAEEPTLVVLDAAKNRVLEGELGAGGSAVMFADMAAVGANPARIIPAWQDFTARHGPGGRRLRGIGEPIWAARTPAELSECHRHEALLNVAFAGDALDFWLLCPYDASALDEEVLDEARRNHPYLQVDGRRSRSASYPGADALAAPFTARLPEAPPGSPSRSFATGDLHDMRAFVAVRAAAAGLQPDQVADFVLAVHEMVANSIRHGQGGGRLTLWSDADVVVCEVEDRGHVVDPLADRTCADSLAEGGRGLWLANQLCDLVQLRGTPTGTVVRVHLRAR